MLLRGSSVRTFRKKLPGSDYSAGSDFADSSSLFRFSTLPEGIMRHPDALRKPKSAAHFLTLRREKLHFSVFSAELSGIALSSSPVNTTENESMRA